MKPHSRIKAARRHLQYSQTALAHAIGVQRSAVSQWEAVGGSNPTLNNLRKIADLTAVQFEWLATGRGPMAITADMALDAIATADALLVDDPIEKRMVEALRSATVDARLMLVQLAEEMARLRRRKLDRSGG